MQTTHAWWKATKSNPQKLTAWLKRQYVGELAAVHLLSELLIRFGSDMTPKQWQDIAKILMQEALHGTWMKELLDARGITPEKNASAEQRYWKEVLPAVDSFEKAVAAGFHAENMRLHRIREIAFDLDAPADIRDVFQRILPHEEWHEKAFAEMMSGVDITPFHEKGLKALNLVLALTSARFSF
jgi:rubrerythrin